MEITFLPCSRFHESVYVGSTIQHTIRELRSVNSILADTHILQQAMGSGDSSAVKGAGLVTERSRVRIPAGAAVEFSSLSSMMMM